MNPPEMIKVYKARVEDALREFFNAKKKEAPDDIVREVIEHLEEYTLRGGKRIRATLVIMGYRLLKGAEDEEIVKAAAALELTQSYMLIHDDIMDESDLRRGGPTYHIIYGEVHRNMGFPGCPKRFGENMAIIAGDLADAYSHELLLSVNLPADVRLRAMRKLTRMVEETGYGQVLDIYSELREDFGEGDLMKVHTLKTAKYTVEGPLHLGAILAGADEDTLRRITDYAIPVGVAFQIHDDILGLFGSEEEIGKPVTSDLAEGKKTLHILYAMEHCTPEEREYLRSVLGRGDVTLEDVERVRDIVRRTGGLDYAAKKAKELVERAKAALEEMEGDDEVKAFLAWLADYVVRRSY